MEKPYQKNTPGLGTVAIEFFCMLVLFILLFSVLGWLFEFGIVWIITLSSVAALFKCFNTTYTDDNINLNVTNHIKILARKRKYLISEDDYGNVDPAAWHNEIRYFLKNSCNISQDVIELEFMSHLDSIEEQVLEFINNQETNDEYSDDFTGIEYEVYCSERLANSGWTPRLTPQTCDQGADIIAEKNGQILVIQCKKSANSIGNKAVQEAFAAKEFYDADQVFVVSNAPYTKSACQLARKCNVMLLHHDQLFDIQ